MMKVLPVVIAAGFLAAAPALDAFAQRGRGGGRPDPKQVLRRMDRNRDGKISRTEFRGPPNRFGKLNANGDGFLTEAELRSAFARRAGQRGGGGGKRRGGGGPTPRLNIPIINTHVHILPRVGRENDWDGAVRNTLKSMDENGVKLSIIMSPPVPSGSEGRWSLGDFIQIQKENPGRFAVMGGGSTLNPMIDGTPAGEVSESVRKRFEETAEDLLKDGAIGFGEMTALHFSFKPSHPYESTQPDHPLFLLLSDIAARRGVPVDIHIEAVVSE
ncbi:MAG: hypothetical protein QF787_13675 [Nitrospinota bacterium]|nr:hypothetical protein [Nitrospinota bacterium]